MARGIFTATTQLTAAALNDCFDPPRCRLFNSANIAAANASQKWLTFDTEIVDDGGMHSTSTNTGRITVPTGGAGYYLVGANVAFDASTTGYRSLEIRVNGTDTIASARVMAVTTGGIGTRMTTSTLYPLAVGDYVEVGVYQTSGGSLDVVSATSYGPIFWAMWVAVS